MRGRRGSTILEFVFVLPLGVALLVGGLSVGSVCVRSLTAGQYARDVALLADSGVDFGSAGGLAQLVERGRGIGLEKNQAAVHVTRVVREPAGLRVDRSYSAGDTQRWPSALRPDEPLELDTGEQVWVVEVFAESGTITSLVPDTVKVRNVL